MPGYDWEPESQQILRELVAKAASERPQVSAEVDEARQTPAEEVHVRIRFDDVFITSLLAGFGFALGVFLAYLLMWIFGGAALFSAVLHNFHR